MQPRPSRVSIGGFALGAVVALAFALVIRLLPSAVVLETALRVAVFAVCALAAPPTVWFVDGRAGWSAPTNVSSSPGLPRVP